MLAVGICGTDFELTRGDYGEAPPNSDFLIIGHESLGEVIEAPAGTDFKKGDVVVGFVRHPDPVPCSACAQGQWDMCRNGQYTEHGIKGRNGFCRERYRLQANHCIKLPSKLRETGVLMEPASVVAKAWDQIMRLLRGAPFKPRKVLVTGAGPIGLLAGLMAVQRGFELHVLNRTKAGPKRNLVQELGGKYHLTKDDIEGETYDIIIECTGADEVVFDVMTRIAPDGIVCLTGVSSRGRKLCLDAGSLNRTIVLSNEIVFGTVNANRQHFEHAADALEKADQNWLHALITRRVPLENWQQAFEHGADDVKTVITGENYVGAH
jgi:threonine dehydrogenase-like Zn-dependent dehydrogenase